MNRNLHNAVRKVDGKREREMILRFEYLLVRESESFQLLARRDPEKEREISLILSFSLQRSDPKMCVCV